MKKTVTEKSPYLAPRCERVYLEQADLLCMSPEEGAIEDVEFEDWTR